MKELIMIQQGLKAPKGQYNSFGKYHYRSCEDILEAVKPLLKEQACTLVIYDEIVMVGARTYVKAIVTLTNAEGGKVQSMAFAREPEEKKGMDESQITGMASSYARKYALNGLFCIDDTKDADTMDNTQPKASPEPQQQKEDDRPWLSEKNLQSILERIGNGEVSLADMATNHYRMKKDYREQIINAVRQYNETYNKA